MVAKIRLHQQPARGTAKRVVHPGEIPPESFEAALDTVHRTAKTRAGIVCGIVIAALVQFMPEGGAHGMGEVLLAVAPALAIACVAFPLIAWMAKRQETRLRAHYGVRRH